MAPVKNIALISLLGFAAYKLFGLINLNNKLKYSFGKYTLSTTATTTKINFDMTITNPTASQLAVKNVVGTILVNNQSIGNFSTGGFDIKPNTATRVAVSTSIGNENLATNIWQAIRNRAIPSITLSGTINTSGGKLPYKNKLLAP